MALRDLNYKSVRRAMGLPAEESRALLARADTAVQVAIDALKRGTDLAGAETFNPLTGDPQLSVSLDGDHYNLDYSPGSGFTYVPSSGSGAAFGGGGGTVGGVQAPASGSYPFDVTDPVRVNEALNYFKGLSPADPGRTAYIEGFNAVRGLGTLSPQDEANLSSKLLESGVYDVGGEVWAQPSTSFNLNRLPESTWEALVRSMYGPAGGFAADFADQQAAIAGGWKNVVRDLYSSPSSRGRMAASNSLPRVFDVTTIPQTPGEWAQVTSQLGQDGWEGYFVVDSLAFQGKLAGGETYTDWPRKVDWRAISDAENINLDRSDLSGVNFVGFNPAGATMWNTNLAGAQGLTAAGLAQTRALSSTNLVGTGIIKRDLREALIAAGKVPGSWNPNFVWNGSNAPDIASIEGDHLFNLDSITFDGVPALTPWASPTP